METGFSAGLALVKAKTLSGSGRVSRVRSGNRVKAFFLSGSGRVSRVKLAGLSGLCGLSSDMAKTSSQTGFSLIPQPRLG
jgi:hypothetical protein